ncbi:porin [Burkholderia sp. Se-20378]|uniref:porin n=1 Tax=unclassified Burkholderia TaxID=2613784 RepID=UPI0027DBF82F|nr:porin [Burkholderia sp. Se-20378]
MVDRAVAAAAQGLDAASTYSKEEGIDNGHLGTRNVGAGGRYTFGDFALDALYVNTCTTLTGAHVDTYDIGGLYRFAPDFFAYSNYLYAKGNRQLERQSLEPGRHHARLPVV